MFDRHLICVLSLASFALMTQGAWAQHQHEGDIIVGIGGGVNPQLRIELDEDILNGVEFVTLPPSVNPVIQGWLADEPGFESIEADEPDEDLFMMGAGARIKLVGVDLDSGLFVRSPSVGTPVRISPTPLLGDLILGGNELHSHAVWHIDPSAPGYRPQTVWYGTFKLVDIGTTGYAESAPFTIGFVPEPASASLLGFGAALAVRRRTRGMKA